MPRKLITLLGLVALSACSCSAPAAEAAEETPVVDLALRLPVGTDSQGRQVQSTLRWARISD